MSLTTMVGEDSFVINDLSIHPDLENGDTVTLEFPEDLVTLVTGKNKNTIYAKNEAGSNFTVSFSVAMNGRADKFLNGLKIQQDTDFARFTLMNGVFTKIVGDGEGNVTENAYVLTGMVFKKHVPMKGNTSGDTEQGKSNYLLAGSVATRGIV